MKKEITLGQFLTMALSLIVILLGWGISVEVRLTQMKAQVENHISIHVEYTKQLEQVTNQLEQVSKTVFDINGCVKKIEGSLSK
jgi:Tfp pilus assembly protein PilO